MGGIPLLFGKVPTGSGCSPGQAIFIGFRFVTTKLSHRDAATFGLMRNHAGSGCWPLAHAINAAGRFAPAIWAKG